MCGLESLPNEIIHNIIQDLDRSTWKMLSMTSRRLRLVAEPLLYHKVRVTNSISALGILRALVHNPRIPSCVKDLRISPYGFLSDTLKCYEPIKNILLLINQYLDQKESGDSVSAEESRKILCMEWDDPLWMHFECDLQEDPAWLEYDMFTVCIVLLLKSFPLVTELTLPMSAELRLSDVLKVYPGRKLVEGDCLSGCLLPNLYRLNLNETFKEKSLHSLFSEYVFWMLHPTVKVVRLSLEKGFEPENEYYGSFIKGKEGKSNVHTVEIIYALRWPTIDGLLKLPKYLKKLRFLDISGSSSLLTEHSVRFSRTISATLVRHASSLSVLEFRPLYGIQLINAIEEFQFARILPSFIRLKRLGLPIDFLLGYTPPGDRPLSDYLPSSLLELLIWSPALGYSLPSRWTDEARVDALVLGLEHLQVRCPGIQKVYCFCFGRNVEKALDRLRSEIQDPRISTILSCED
jgi:hypothetical protein